LVAADWLLPIGNACPELRTVMKHAFR